MTNRLVIWSLTTQPLIFLTKQERSDFFLLINKYDFMKKIIWAAVVMLIAGLFIFASGRVANTGPPIGGLLVGNDNTGNIDLNNATQAVIGELVLAPLARDATLILANKFATIHGSPPASHVIGLVSVYTSGRSIMKTNNDAIASYQAGNNQGPGDINLIAQSMENTNRVTAKTRNAASESYHAGNNQGPGDISKIAQLTENTCNRRIIRA